MNLATTKLRVHTLRYVALAIRTYARARDAHTHKHTICLANVIWKAKSKIKESLQKILSLKKLKQIVFLRKLPIVIYEGTGIEQDED